MKHKTISIFTVVPVLCLFSLHTFGQNKAVIIDHTCTGITRVPPAQIEKAKKIVNAFQVATEKGLGVVSLGTKMIDQPVVKRAQRTIDIAVKTGKLKKNWEEEEHVN